MTTPVKNAPGDVDFGNPPDDAPKPVKQPDSIKATVSEGTEYVVLSRIDGGKWEELTGRITARGNEAAVRAYLDATKESPNNTVEYVAVPVRSWTPLKVRVQTVTTLKLEEAK